MNRVILIGRLTKDPELKFTPGTGTAVTRFTLAVDRRAFKDKEKEADFINCLVWNKTAEAIANYVQKGRLLAISGRIQTRSYDAKDGTKRYITEVVADEIQFLDKAKLASSSLTASASSAESEATYDEPELTELGGDDIPF